MPTNIDTIEIAPKSSHQYSIIWLHGLGADGHDFESIVPSLRLTAQDHIHFIFPNAPIQAVTINGGVKMRAWYDIIEKTLERKVDVNGIHESALLISNLINQEIEKGISANRILLAGFSQGGVIALHAGLNFKQNLAGIVALSTYFPTLNELDSTPNGTPIFMAHGILDSIVEIESGKAVFNSLQTANHQIEWHDYLMEHSVNADEIKDIAAFINKMFKD